MSKVKTLEEIKKMMGEKCFETNTCFGVNRYGKYRPNITFLIPKRFETDPLEYRSDSVIQSIFILRIIDFDGSASVLFGDYWISRNNNSCFRPKSIRTATHMLICVSWGGAFNDSRGYRSEKNIGEIYFRRASSNGGGTGYDYWVFPIGFRRIVQLEEVDGNSKSEINLAQEAQKIRDKIIDYDREQKQRAKAKAKAEAEAKAKAIADSRKSKPNFLDRLNKINVRREAHGLDKFEFGEIYFCAGEHKCFYTEVNVSYWEKRVRKWDEERAERLRQKNIQEKFRPKYKAYISRLNKLGCEIRFRTEEVYINEMRMSFAYSDNGLEKFLREIKRLEEKKLEEKIQVEEKVRYDKACQRAEKLGLPKDIRIWYRDSGSTNQGKGWVIGANGQDRAPSHIYTSRRGLKQFSRYTQGDLIWEQIFPGEVVLKWSKEFSAAPHVFEVIHKPEEGLTEAQRERISEIERRLDERWKGARGFASKKKSPPVGQGWDL